MFKNFTRDTMLIDATGRYLPASHVFKCFIKAFVNHIKEHLDRMSFDLKKDKIRWVIPVSAYWTDNDKHFLRACAEQVSVLCHSTTMTNSMLAFALAV